MRNIPDIKELLAENKRRNDDYFREVDQVAGDSEGEVLPRFLITISGKTYWFPEDMRNEPIIRKLSRKSIPQIIKDVGDEPTRENEDDVFRGVMILRMRYDFEFFAVMCLTIQDKLTKANIPFVLNKGQRELLKSLEDMRRRGIPIRIVLVKARQWGGSTLTEMYFLWLQIFHYPNWHSGIIAKVSAQAANIRAMITKAINNFPPEIMKISIRTFEGMNNTKYIPERGCRMTISSAEAPEVLRSYDFSLLHLSEVATWPDTPQKSGDDLAQALASTVPYEEGTAIVEESTAKGVGGYFHDEWLYACSGDNEIEGKKTPVFVPWFKIKMYRREIRNMDKMLSSMSDYNWWQWKQGATLEGICWYNNFKASQRWGDFQMRSEYPTTADEAFQTKAGKYFSDFMLEYLREYNKEPIFTGDIRGRSTIGEESLSDIYLEKGDEFSSNMLKIWIMPEDPRGTVITNRFVVVVDIGGLTYKADNSVISVFDRAGLLNPHGCVERAALWVGHIDHDILAWKAAQIATFYHNALLVIESNTIDTKEKKSDTDITYEGDHSYTVLNEIADVYGNMYMRRTGPDKAKQRNTMNYGWHMNRKTKYQAYDDYRNKIRDRYYIEYSAEAANEASWLQLTKRGKIEAAKGRRDDIQDTTAVGVYIANNVDEMDLPKMKDIAASKKKRTRRNGGESSF